MAVQESHRHVQHTSPIAVSRSSICRMYTKEKDTEAPGSKKSKKKFKLIASSFVFGRVSLYCVQSLFVQAWVALLLVNPKWLTRPA